MPPTRFPSELALPAALHTGEAGTFAHTTLSVRVPEILRSVRRDLGPLPANIAARFDALEAELSRGSVQEFSDVGPDAEHWRTATRPHVGRTWLDLPWFFAESLFYRRVLEATGFFSEGPLFGVDPFRMSKLRELTREQGLGRLERVLANIPASPRERLRHLLLASLWGNRVDLSYNVAAALGSQVGDPTDLLVDDTDAVSSLLLKGRERVALVADNAGTELLMDLAFARDILALGGPMVLHLKAQPTFVSDATIEDFEATLGALSEAEAPGLRELGGALAEHLHSGQLSLVPDPFFTSSFHYPNMPTLLSDSFRQCALVIFKGDANYRRLCSDAHWPHRTPFADVVRYFPAPLVALRTLKSELIVGLRSGQAEQLTLEDPEWLVNGRRAVIQARLS